MLAFEVRTLDFTFAAPLATRSQHLLQSIFPVCSALGGQKRALEGIESPETRLTGGFELPDVGTFVFENLSWP